MKIFLVYFLIWGLVNGQSLNPEQLLAGATAESLASVISGSLLSGQRSIAGSSGNAFTDDQININFRPGFEAESKLLTQKAAFGHEDTLALANANAAAQTTSFTPWFPKQDAASVSSRSLTKIITNPLFKTQAIGLTELDKESSGSTEEKSFVTRHFSSSVSSSTSQSSSTSSTASEKSEVSSNNAKSYSNVGSPTKNKIDISAKAIAKAEAEAKAASEAAVAAQADAIAQAKAATRAKAEASAAAAAEARAEAKAWAEAEARVQAEARANASAQAEAKAKAEASAKAEAKAKAEAEAQAQTKARVDAEERAAASARAEAKARAQAKAEAEVSARAEAMARAEAKARAEAEARAEASAQAEAEAKAEAAAGAKAVVEAKLAAQINTVTEAYINAVTKAEASAKTAAVASIATMNAAKAIKLAASAQAQAAIKATAAEEAAAAAAVSTSEVNVAASAVEAALMLSMMISQSADLAEKTAISYVMKLVKMAMASEAANKFIESKTINDKERVALATTAVQASLSKHIEGKQKMEQLSMYQEVTKETSTKAAVAQSIALEHAKLVSREVEEAAKIQASASAKLDSNTAELESTMAVRTNFQNAIRDGIVVGLNAVPKLMIRHVEIKTNN
ncbi:hypothetical protein EAI_14296 [Harpegnathos saltator]|uniref:Uncharacterized protein n=2 Tax=Harpegnathos saltator TaxID=610380 RepID=E2BRH6_HARSA|nr:hypothetical protein EAI_14296 [Harpegnathos saltator]